MHPTLYAYISEENRVSLHRIIVLPDGSVITPPTIKPANAREAVVALAPTLPLRRERTSNATPQELFPFGEAARYITTDHHIFALPDPQHEALIQLLVDHNLRAPDMILAEVTSEETVNAYLSGKAHSFYHAPVTARKKRHPAFYIMGFLSLLLGILLYLTAENIFGL